MVGYIEELILSAEYLRVFTAQIGHFVYGWLLEESWVANPDVFVLFSEELRLLYIDRSDPSLIVETLYSDLQCD